MADPIEPNSPTAPEACADKCGVLLVNLGTPDAPTPEALKRYLKEFLSDERVVDLPRWSWLPILHLVILRTRPKRSAELYQKIWTDRGSPLLVTTEDQATALSERLSQHNCGDVPVAFGMRYGTPSIEAGIAALRDVGCDRVVVLPAFPQYSIATTLSVEDVLTAVQSRLDHCPKIEMIGDYHDQPGYIAALANSVKESWQQHGRGERLLISFHGTPVRYRDEKGDPYFGQCETTARLLAGALGLTDDEWTLAFQSRFGPEEWLQPYTDHTLDGWGRDGIKTVDVICPGFAADCLETLEEIAIGCAESFIEEGGERLNYIPALNARPDHIAALADVVVTAVGAE